MKSNYKPLGNYIKQIKKKNTDASVSVLKGIRINKEFMESVANIQGTDLSRYRVVKKYQFAYNPMHVGRDEILPISVFLEDDPIIVSPAYVVFEILDHNVLDPEYLMMWCRRSEFDRNVWFTTDSSVRGGFSWESLCELELPIPSIEKQHDIVKEYNTIVSRITLNETLNQKLEETAQALYKNWFVDFEFPNVEGKPYKSSGGKMEYNEELGIEIPFDFEYLSIQNLIDEEIIFKNQDGNHGEIHPKSADYVLEGIPFIMAKDIRNGTININSCSFISRDHSKRLRIDPAISNDVLITHKASMGRVAIVPQTDSHLVLTPQVTYYRVKNRERINKEFLYCLFCSSNFQQEFIGNSAQSTRNFLSITNQRSMKIILPNSKSLKKFKKTLFHLLFHKNIINEEMVMLTELLVILNSMMSKVETKTVLV
jgi:type I restriction enzyme S subunit